MCGIAGFVGEGSDADLGAMTATLRHRGPDGHGAHCDRQFRVALGHQRLVVLDPEGGHQPMWNEDRTVAVVFNGEIYNAGELRAELLSKGHVFVSDHSDTEVLVHGYEQWRSELPIRLNGMFAFAVFDAKQGRLFLARDRFGEKPLYYHASRGLFAFASELSALLSHTAIPTVLDPKGIQKLFAYGYIPAPWTAVRGIWKLPAASTLEYDCSTEALVQRKYWTFRLEPDERLESAREETLVEELRMHLSEAVRRRLVSDVPLGVFLSGGIDSAAVVAFATKHVRAGDLKTFTVGFGEASYDESEPAARLAEWFGTDHKATRLDLRRAIPLIPGLFQQLDEPLADPSLLPTSLVCQFARESVTVALSGDGGDELFAGYDPFLALSPARAYSRLIPDAVHVLVRHAASRLLPHGSSYMSWDFRVRRALVGLSYPPSLWNPVWMAPVEPMVMSEYFENPLPPEELYEEALATWNASDQPDLCSRTLEFFTAVYLQNDILTKVDRASMRVSLESRAVFLDVDLVDFCRRLPNRWKLRNRTRKYLLRKALEGLVPADVLTRRKQGFAVPVADWLRQLPFPDAHPDVPGIKREAFRHAWRKHAEEQSEERLLLWTWLALSTWATRQPHRETVAV